MANVSRVNGLRPVKHLNGSPYNGQVNIYYLPAGDATATFVGDAVKLGGSADANGIPTIAQAAATNALVGVVVGFVPLKMDPVGGSMTSGSTSLDTPQYRPASTAMYALVADAPDLVFEVQEDAVGGAAAVADVGLNASLVVGSGSTTTGASGMQLDTSTKATTATLELKIRGFVVRPDNEVGSANAKLLVSINNHQLGSSTGTAGV